MRGVVSFSPVEAASLAARGATAPSAEAPFFVAGGGALLVCVFVVIAATLDDTGLTRASFFRKRT